MITIKDWEYLSNIDIDRYFIWENSSTSNNPVRFQQLLENPIFGNIVVLQEQWLQLCHYVQHFKIDKVVFDGVTVQRKGDRFFGFDMTWYDNPYFCFGFYFFTVYWYTKGYIYPSRCYWSFMESLVGKASKFLKGLKTSCL